MAASAANPNNDIEVGQAPTDSISTLIFSPKANFLVAGSWSNELRCYQIQSNGQSLPTSLATYQAPVLCATWSGDGSSVFSGVCDKTVKKWDLASGTSSDIGRHDAAVKEIAFVPDMNVIATGSWDKTIRYWDGRAPQAQATVNLPERCYAMDVASPLMVVGTADRQVLIYDLRKYNNPYKTCASPLKMQTRCISCFPDKTGFAIGSIEGRVGIHHVEDRDSNKNFAFKCHRVDQEIYAINVIKFHQQHGTFATCGSDGVFNFWDKENKTRLKQFNRCAQPISAATFNFDGSIFAYAVSYDWSKGHEGYNRNLPNQIFLHAVGEAEIKPKKNKK